MKEEDSQKINETEKELNEKIYSLYDLDEKDIKIIEENLSVENKT